MVIGNYPSPRSFSLQFRLIALYLMEYTEDRADDLHRGGEAEVNDGKVGWQWWLTEMPGWGGENGQISSQTRPGHLLLPKDCISGAKFKFF